MKLWHKADLFLLLFPAPQSPVVSIMCLVSVLWRSSCSAGFAQVECKLEDHQISALIPVDPFFRERHCRAQLLHCSRLLICPPAHWRSWKLFLSFVYYKCISYFPHWFNQALSVKHFGYCLQEAVPHGWKGVAQAWSSGHFTAVVRKQRGDRKWVGL